MITTKKKYIFMIISLSKLNICLEYIYHKIKNNNKITCFNVDKHKIIFYYTVYVDFHEVIEIKLFFTLKVLASERVIFKPPD